MHPQDPTIGGTRGHRKGPRDPVLMNLQERTGPKSVPFAPAAPKATLAAHVWADQYNFRIGDLLGVSSSVLSYLCWAATWVAGRCRICAVRMRRWV